MCNFVYVNLPFFFEFCFKVLWRPSVSVLGSEVKARS